MFERTLYDLINEHCLSTKKNTVIYLKERTVWSEYATLPQYKGSALAELLTVTIGEGKSKAFFPQNET